MMMKTRKSTRRLVPRPVATWRTHAPPAAMPATPTTVTSGTTLTKATPRTTLARLVPTDGPAVRPVARRHCQLQGPTCPMGLPAQTLPVCPGCSTPAGPLRDRPQKCGGCVPCRLAGLRSLWALPMAALPSGGSAGTRGEGGRPQQLQSCWPCPHPSRRPPTNWTAAVMTDAVMVATTRRPPALPRWWSRWRGSRAPCVALQPPCHAAVPSSCRCLRNKSWLRALRCHSALIDGGWLIPAPRERGLLSAGQWRGAVTGGGASGRGAMMAASAPGSWARGRATGAVTARAAPRAALHLLPHSSGGRARRTAHPLGSPPTAPASAAPSQGPPGRGSWRQDHTMTTYGSGTCGLWTRGRPRASLPSLPLEGECGGHGGTHCGETSSSLQPCGRARSSVCCLGVTTRITLMPTPIPVWPWCAPTGGRGERRCRTAARGMQLGPWSRRAPSTTAACTCGRGGEERWSHDWP